MNKKNNKKYQKTDAHICETFLALLKENSFDTISISLLCQTAGVTRATFYSHFGDMDHFYDHLAEQLFTELTEQEWKILLTDVTAENIYHVSMISLFEHILEYRDFYQIYVQKVSQLPFLHMLDSFHHTEGLRKYAAYHGITTKRQADYLSTFYYTGLTAMIRLWLETGCSETPEEMFELISKQAQGMNHSGIEEVCKC